MFRKPPTIVEFEEGYVRGANTKRTPPQTGSCDSGPRWRELPGSSHIWRTLASLCDGTRDRTLSGTAPGVGL